MTAMFKHSPALFGGLDCLSTDQIFERDRAVRRLDNRERAFGRRRLLSGDNSMNGNATKADHPAKALIAEIGGVDVGGERVLVRHD